MFPIEVIPLKTFYIEDLRDFGISYSYDTVSPVIFNNNLQFESSFSGDVTLWVFLWPQTLTKLVHISTDRS